jgi:hypothetical protein
MDLPMAVIDSYDAARAQGQSRPDALFGAVTLYLLHRPELSISEAGNEVVRILRAAADVAAAEGTARTCVAAARSSGVEAQQATSSYGG